MKFLCALCVLCGLAAPALALDREAFTFTKYDLNVRIEPEQQRLAVRGTITLRNDSSTPLKNLSLQISASLAWRSIQLGGKPVQFVSQPYTSDIDHTGGLSEAIVILPQEIPPKGAVELEIGYEGVIALDTTRLTRIGVSKEQAKHTDWDQIGESFAAVRGVGYVVWYPVAIEAASLSDGNSVFDALGRWKLREKDADVKIALNDEQRDSNADLLLFCNGKGARVIREDGLARFLFTDCSFPPLGRAVPVFAMARYSEVDSHAIDIFYSSAHKVAAENYARAAEKVIPFTTDWFGAPHEKAQLVELLDPDGAPYESGSTLLSPLGDIDSQQAEVAVAHQLTHAFFSSPRLWIYEGIPHFAQAMYRERQDGRQAALDFMTLHIAAIIDTEKTLAAERNSKASEEQSLINTNIEELYRSKAMYVWWMLRDMVGEQALKRALAAYRPDQDTEPSYLQRLVETQNKSDLTWFFDDWVYHDRGLPDFRVDSVYPSQATQGTYMVTVTIENLGGAGAEVPVTVRSGDSEVTKRLEVHAKSKNSFRVVVPSLPQEVVVNDGGVPESDMSNNVFKVRPASEAH
jgi:hypothetical protein